MPFHACNRGSTPRGDANYKIEGLESSPSIFFYQKRSPDTSPDTMPPEIAPPGFFY